jgi:hypothetical protein
MRAPKETCKSFKGTFNSESGDADIRTLQGQIYEYPGNKWVLVPQAVSAVRFT